MLIIGWTLCYSWYTNFVVFANIVLLVSYNCFFFHLTSFPSSPSINLQPLPTSGESMKRARPQQYIYTCISFKETTTTTTITTTTTSTSTKWRSSPKRTFFFILTVLNELVWLKPGFIRFRRILVWCM